MWFRVDDNWADSAKVDVLSDVAARLWVMAGAWCRKRENLHLDGFVPRAALATITKRRWSSEELEAAIFDLVETSRLGGVHEHGLWEPCEGGWRFHDWARYQPEEEAPKLSPEEAASKAGQASAKARKEKHGTAQPPKRRTPPERAPNVDEPFERRSSDVRDGGDSATPNGSRTPTERALERGLERSRTEQLETPEIPRTASERLEPPIPNPIPNPMEKQIREPDSSDHSERPVQRRRQLRELTDLRELCQAALENPHNASYHALHAREEFIQANRIWCQALDLAERQLSVYQSDSRVKALVTLYASGYTLDDIRVMAAEAPADPHITRNGEGLPRGLEGLTPVVAGKLLESARRREKKAQVEAARKRAELEKEREARKELTRRPRQPVPQFDINKLFGSVPGRTEQPRRPQPRTAEELDRALEQIEETKP